MKIEKFKCENLTCGCVTDNKTPTFSYTLASHSPVKVADAQIEVDGISFPAVEQTAVKYAGKPLKPFTAYTATLTVTTESGESAQKSVEFSVGRLDTPWQGKWITDGSYIFTEKKTSPEPMTFKKSFNLKSEVESVKIYSTALGIYKIALNGDRVGADYFAPGFTSYTNRLQYQVYDISNFVKEQNEVLFTVAGGWAVGAFVMTRANRITADRQALLAEIRVRYKNGVEEVFGTGEDWLVTRGQSLRFAEFYDGEVYDATVNENALNWRKATLEKIKINPEIIANYGAPVRLHEVFKPVSCKKHGEELIYDFGQNLAGVVRFKVNGKAGQKITIRHAEVLTEDGGLNTTFLRSAKCKIEYICKDGEQTYTPEFTYMGYRYAGVSGVDEKDIQIESVALYSDIEENGKFECSNELINQLQSNVVWSGKSNFVDIPTDCPQRDERMGWTGDIAIFAQTACYNFDMSRFLDKWLKDVRSEQTRHGGIPNTVPHHGYGFPVTMPKKAIAFWGDACVLVPWAMYLSYGDINVLKQNYTTMKKYFKACKWWANIGVGKHRYIWSDIPAMQFGDWVAPDVPKMSQWQARCKWTGTASLAAMSGLLTKIANLLGNEKDAKYYQKINAKVNDAFVSILTDGKGKLKNEFQTAYVLPLYFNMFPQSQRKAAVDNLAALIEKNNYCIGTGFPGTPYILFALADNGRADVAFKMLLNTKCPSWLYEVKAGATTVWERWDGLDEDGVCRIGNDGTGGMISFNHYGFGAVGDFLYRRIAGIEPINGGYKEFKIAPLVGGGLTYAKGEVISPYGKISSSWKIENGNFTLETVVPVNTACQVLLPNGEKITAECGKHAYVCKIK